MLFNDTDHEAFAALAKSTGIGLTTYAEFAEKIGKRIDFLDGAMTDAERDAESARDAAAVADDANADFIDFTRDLYRTFGPHACSKPTERDLADLIKNARELLARNGVNP